MLEVLEELEELEKLLLDALSELALLSELVELGAVDTVGSTPELALSLPEAGADLAFNARTEHEKYRTCRGFGRILIIVMTLG